MAVVWQILLEAGLILILPLVFYRPVTEQFSTPKIIVTEWLVVAGLAVAAITYFWRRGPAPRLHFAWPIALLACSVLLSCVNSPSPEFSLDQARYFLCGPAWLLILFSFPNGPSTLRRLSLLMASAGTLVAIITLAQWLGHDPLVFGGFQVAQGKLVDRMALYSTFGNPNLVAGYLVGVVFIVLALGLVAQGLAAKLVWFASAAAIVLAIVGTQSHGAWAALILGFLTWLWLLRSRPAPNPEIVNTASAIPGHAGLKSSICLLFFPPTFIGLAVPMFSNLPERLMDQLTGRMYLWRVSWPLFAQHPLLGCGWGSFQLRFLELQARFLAAHPDQAGYWSNIAQLHNDPLQLLLETGVLGLGAFVWLLWAYSKELREGLIAGDSQTRHLLAASAGGMAAILADSVFNFQFAVPPTLILIFTLMAFPALISAPDKDHGQPPSLRSMSLRVLASLAALVCAAFLCMQTAQFAGAEIDYARGVRFEMAGDAGLNEAEQAYRDGLALNPRSGRIHYGLSRVLYMQQKLPSALAEAELAEQTPFLDSHLEILKARIQVAMGLNSAALVTYGHALALEPALKILQGEIAPLERKTK
ncbi:MAG TPA: O-antigen ligase family protein [Terriglobia bacterium]|nr:O-antigen ligase family protein [Terriglobia bacterium]